MSGVPIKRADGDRSSSHRMMLMGLRCGLGSCMDSGESLMPALLHQAALAWRFAFLTVPARIGTGCGGVAERKVARASARMRGAFGLKPKLLLTPPRFAPAVWGNARVANRVPV